MTNFAEKLKATRTYRKMSQKELHNKSGVPYKTISHYETEIQKPSLPNLIKLADALQVSTDYLLERDEHAFKGMFDSLTSEQQDVVTDLIMVLNRKNKLLNKK